MTTRLKDLQDKAAAAMKTARETAELAAKEDRDMSADERTKFDAAMKDGGELLGQIRAAKADADLLAQARSMAEEIGMPIEVQEDVTAQLSLPERQAMLATLGQQFVQSSAYKDLLQPFNGRPIPERSRINSDPVEFKTLIGVKNLLTGSSKTSSGAFVVNDRTDIVEMLGRRPLTIRDLISIRRTESDVVEFVRQTSHTNNAAVVPEATSAAAPTAPTGTAGGPLVNDPNGGYKPSTDWTFEVASTSVKVIAEWTPATKRALADVGQLEGLINDELVKDIEEAEEDQIMSGNGIGQNLTGILTTSGIQTQAATTTNDATKFASFRTAIRKLRTVGRVAASAIVVNPTQGEWIDTARDAQNRFYGNGPFGLAPRTMWGVPVVESESIPAGTALVGDYSKAVLWDREQATITATDSHADFFIRNLVAILAEERVAFAVTRPPAFCTVTGL